MQLKRVLIVDDSLAITRQLENIIERSSEFEVVAKAKNGVEALKIYSQLKPDIVLMDLVMPQMDGLQAIRSILSLDNEATIVVISSVGGVGDKVEQALRFGAKNVITKPFEATTIIEIMHQVLSLKPSKR